MKKLIYLLPLIFSNLYCSNNNQPKQVAQIKFSAEACYGSCPVFSMIINKDKTASYNAVEHNKTEGEFSAVIKQHDYESLINQINEADVSSLKDNYSIDETDHPGCTLTVKFLDGSVKTIKDESQRGTEELKKLYDLIFDLRENQSWK